MKLSEQIANTCCGVLADKQEMIDKAIRMEEYIIKQSLEIANSVSKQEYRKLLLKLEET